MRNRNANKIIIIKIGFGGGLIGIILLLLIKD